MSIVLADHSIATRGEGAVLDQDEAKAVRRNEFRLARYSGRTLLTRNPSPSRVMSLGFAVYLPSIEITCSAAVNGGRLATNTVFV